MDYLGHNEFGEGYEVTHAHGIYKDFNHCNHWLEQWFLHYSKILEQLPSIKEGVVLISYERLCDNNSVFKSLLNFIGIEDDHISCNFRLSHKENILPYDPELLRKSLELHKSLLQSENCLV